MTGWTRQGECNRCGHCCEHLVRDVQVRTPAEVAQDEPFYRVRGFKAMETTQGTRHVLWAWVAARCPELIVDAYPDAFPICRIYERRPQTCQDFPQRPRDIIATPCSYWFERGTEKVGGDGSPYPTSIERLLVLEATGEA